MEKRARVGVVFFAFLGVLVFDRKERKLKIQAETKVFQILFPRTFRVGNNAVLKRTRIAGIYIYIFFFSVSSHTFDKRRDNVATLFSIGNFYQSIFRLRILHYYSDTTRCSDLFSPKINWRARESAKRVK